MALQWVEVGNIRGKSAYQIAVDHGFVGNEAAWLASLKGADGADGQDGANGADGADGVDGQDGTGGGTTVTVVTEPPGEGDPDGIYIVPGD